MTISPLSRSESVSDFQRLDPRIQRWVWEKGWTGLRDAQERAIAPIMAADRDVIIAAATAAGKTEAAFLPALTVVANAGEESGLIVYVSPLKALINDQFGRLDQLCEILELPVIPWHGDVPASRKKKFLKTPRGVLLITPESLEAMFVRRGSGVGHLFGEATHIVIDELHAFIGSDRGKQMQSLLHRIDAVADRKIPRVGLSATLGDMQLAAEYLRPGAADDVVMIVSEAKNQTMQIQVRGYLIPIRVKQPPAQMQEGDGEEVAPHERAIVDHLYKTLCGSNNLVFPNTRAQVEHYTDALRRKCEMDGRPIEFWPHHGSLSRGLREETEEALKRGDRPATAICTNTLELGIDIGAVKSIAQIGPGPSVASLRQRLGRSGRRPGEPAILRSYAQEHEIRPDSSYSDRLREGLVQSIAMIQLLLRGWFEPPNSSGLHLSTLVQQVLSVITERGGAKAAELYRNLVTHGAFGGMSQSEFGALLRSLAGHQLISQDPSGLLLLGAKGEPLVANYDFYAAFASEDEWQIAAEGRVMGSLPISSSLIEGMRIIFGGRRWVVMNIDEAAKVISVRPSPGGRPPSFDSGKPSVHDVVRQEMRSVLAGTDVIQFLDKPAAGMLEEARNNYRLLQLDQHQWIQVGSQIDIFTWSGDATNETLFLMLRSLGIEDIGNSGLTVSISRKTQVEVVDAMMRLREFDMGEIEPMLGSTRNMSRGKWDWALPSDLIRKSFASSHLNILGAKKLAVQLLQNVER